MENDLHAMASYIAFILVGGQVTNQPVIDKDFYKRLSIETLIQK